MILPSQILILQSLIRLLLSKGFLLGIPANEFVLLEDRYENLPLRLKSQGAINKAMYSIYLNEPKKKNGTVLFGAVDHAKYTVDLITAPALKLTKYDYTTPEQFAIRIDKFVWNVILKVMQVHFYVVTHFMRLVRHSEVILIQISMLNLCRAPHQTLQLSALIFLVRRFIFHSQTLLHQKTRHPHWNIVILQYLNKTQLIPVSRREYLKELVCCL